MSLEPEKHPTVKMIGDSLGYQVNVLSDSFGEMKVVYAVPHKGRYCNDTYIRITTIEDAVAEKDTDKLSDLLLDYDYPHIFVSSNLSVEESYDALKSHIFETA